MNKTISSLQPSSSISIFGKRQSGKLTLAWYFASQLTKDPVTLISPFSKSFLNKKIQANANGNSNLQLMLDNLVSFNLKSDWKEQKNYYGYSFFNKEIEKIISESNEVIIFHRIDSFFEIQDSNEIESFIFNIISFSLALDKKIIITVNMSNSNSDYIYECFEKSIDSEFLISKIPHNHKARSVELISSLFTVEHSDFTFEFDSPKGEFKLSPRQNGDISIGSKPSFHVVLASESSELISIVKYLFDKDSFDLKIISPTITEIMDLIADDSPHVIIFNPDERQTESEFKKIGSVIINSKNKSIFISSQPFIRNQDKLRVLTQGFSYALGKEFYIEELILAIEVTLGYNFYNEEMEKIPDKNYIIYEYKIFYDFVNVLLRKNIFFSIFKFKYKTPVDDNDLKSSLWRNFDIVYSVKKDNVFYLFLINTLKQHLPAITGKMKSINKTIELVDIKESIDFIK